MEGSDLKEAIEKSKRLTLQLEKYNNMLAGSMYLMVFITVLIIVMLIKVMGWV